MQAMIGLKLSRAIFFQIFFLFTFMMTPVWAGTTVADTRAKALAWLIKTQAPDGSWSNPGEQRIITTAAVVTGMSGVGYRGDFFRRGLGWVVSQEGNGTDEKARILAALVAGGISFDTLDDKCNKLVASASLQTINDPTTSQLTLTRAGWGADAGAEIVDSGGPQATVKNGYGTVSFIDTALAVETLSYTRCFSNEVQRQAAFVLSTGKTSNTGGFPWGATKFWGGNGDATDAVIPTAQTIKALTRFNDAPLQSRVALALGWLDSQQVNGSYDSNNILSTAYALAAYEDTGNSNYSLANSARTWLIAQQSADGSFGQDAFLTAMVLNALPKISPAAATLPDADNDGIPDEVELVLSTDPNNAGDRYFPESRLVGAPIGSSATADVLLGQPITPINLVATCPPGSCGTLSWTFLDGRLPSGITQNVAQFTGTPTAAGNYLAQYKVTDALGRSGAATLSMRVLGKLRIANIDRNLVTQTNTKLQLDVSDAVLPFSSAAVTAGALPPGLVLDRDGVVNGVATTPGIYDCTIKVTDLLGRVANAQVKLRVLSLTAVINIF